jgi:hypothetical protein
MAANSRPFGRFSLDWSAGDPQGPLNERAQTQARWEDGVVKTLDVLTHVAPGGGRVIPGPVAGRT